MPRCERCGETILFMSAPCCDRPKWESAEWGIKRDGAHVVIGSERPLAPKFVPSRVKELAKEMSGRLKRMPGDYPVYIDPTRVIGCERTIGYDEMPEIHIWYVNGFSDSHPLGSSTVEEWVAVL